MAIGVYFNFPGSTLDQYDEAGRRLNNGQPMRALADWPVIVPLHNFVAS